MTAKERVVIIPGDQPWEDIDSSGGKDFEKRKVFRRPLLIVVAVVSALTVHVKLAFKSLGNMSKSKFLSFNTKSSEIWTQVGLQEVLSPDSSHTNL